MKLGKSPTLLQSLAASVPREKHRGWGDGSMLDTLAPRWVSSIQAHLIGTTAW